MKFLITGGAGFIGSTIVKKLISQNHNVVAIDSFDSTLYSNSLKLIRSQILKSCGVNVISMDLSSKAARQLYPDFDVVINEAGIPGQLVSWNCFDSYMNSNLKGVQAILESIKNSNTRLIQASTSSVYGKSAIGDENQRKAPCSPYGVTKLAAENLIEAYAQNYKLNYSILRYFSVFGPSQRPDMAIHIFLQKIRNGVPIEVTGDGTQIRDITFVDDIVDGTILASTLDSEKSCFNLSGGNIYSVNEILKTCFQVVGKKVPIKYIDRPKGDQDSTIGDSTLAIQSLGFRPKVNIEEGITAQYEYLCRYT